MIEIKASVVAMVGFPRTIQFTENITELKQFLEDLFAENEVVSTHNIIYAIEEYLFGIDYNFSKNEDELEIEVNYDSMQIEIINSDELLEYFSYLIKDKVDCCKTMNSNCRYCYICGKKLKWN